jgi:hypothetical protein
VNDDVIKDNYVYCYVEVQGVDVDESIGSTCIETDIESYEYEIGELQLQLDEVLHTNNDLLEENLALKNQVFSLQNRIQLLQSSQQQQCLQFQHNMSSLQRITSATFGVTMIKGDDKATCFYTGLSRYSTFDGVFNILLPLVPLKKAELAELSLIDEFFCFLVKLRLGVPNQDIAFRLNVSVSTVAKFFKKWLDIASRELECIIAWSYKEHLMNNIPRCFQKHYKTVRCIVDCFEIFIERPTSYVARAATYSNYKKHNTIKVFVAISPTRSICFISKGWGGRVSDRAITSKCGFLDKIEHGDTVMADRGFNIADELAVRGAKLLIPAFTRGKPQLPKKDVELTRQLAKRRVHVERVIGQLRKKYKILTHTLPINMINSSQDKGNHLCTIDKILIVTAALTNLSQSIIPD